MDARQKDFIGVCLCITAALLILLLNALTGVVIVHPRWSELTSTPKGAVYSIRACVIVAFICCIITMATWISWIFYLPLVAKRWTKIIRFVAIAFIILSGIFHIAAVSVWSNSNVELTNFQKKDESSELGYSLTIACIVIAFLSIAPIVFALQPRICEPTVYVSRRHHYHRESSLSTKRSQLEVRRNTDPKEGKRSRFFNRSFKPISPLPRKSKNSRLKQDLYIIHNQNKINTIDEENEYKQHEQASSSSGYIVSDHDLSEFQGSAIHRNGQGSADLCKLSYDMDQSVTHEEDDGETKKRAKMSKNGGKGKKSSKTVVNMEPINSNLYPTTVIREYTDDNSNHKIVNGACTNIRNGHGKKLDVNETHDPDNESINECNTDSINKKNRIAGTMNYVNKAFDNNVDDTVINGNSDSSKPTGF